MVSVSTASVAAVFVSTFEAFRSALPNGILYGKPLSLVMDLKSASQEDLRLPLHVPGATLGLTGLSLDAKWKALLGCRYLYGGALEAFVSKAEGLGVEPATRQWNRERLDATEEFCAEAGERAHGALDLDSILDEDAEHVQAFLEDSVVSLNGLRYQFPSHAACASGELYEPPTFECLPRSLLWGDIYLPELSQAYKVQRTLSPDPEDRGALLEWTPEGCHCAWWDVGCSLVSNHGACVKMLRDASRNGRIVITVLLVFVSAIGVCLMLRKQCKILRLSKKTKKVRNALHKKETRANIRQASSRVKSLRKAQSMHIRRQFSAQPERSDSEPYWPSPC